MKVLLNSVHLNGHTLGVLSTDTKLSGDTILPETTQQK